MLRNACLAYSLLLSVSLAEMAQALEIASPESVSTLGQRLKLRAALTGGAELTLPIATAVECQSPECRDIRLRSRVSGRQSGNLAIEVTSLDAVTQPAFVLRLRVSAGSETRTHDVTVLLDPPAYQVRQVLLAAMPQAESSPTPPRRSRPPKLPVAATVPNPMPARPEGATTSEVTATQVTVQPGDTLSQIARRLARRQGGRAQDWADRLVRDNPKAFVNGDANRLIAGAVLSLTTPVAAEPVPALDRPATSPTDAVPVTSSEPAAIAASRDETHPVVGAEATTVEATSAARAEQLALQERLARMELRLQKLEAALLAESPLPADPVKTTASSPPPTSEALAKLTDPDSAQALEPSPATETTITDRPSAELAAPTPSLVPEVVGEASPPAPANHSTEAGPTAAVGAVAALDPQPSASTSTTTTSPSPATSIASSPTPAAESILPDELISMWTLLAGGGLVCAGLLLLGLRGNPLKSAPRDRKGPGPAADEAIKAAIRERLQDEPSAPNTAEDHGPLTLDLGKLKRGLANGEENDSVISEVDVHIVYGAFAEAEAVLDEALAARGGAPQLLVKLAEVYYYQRDAAKLAALGERVKNLDLPAWVWAKVFRLGHDLCPDQPVFADPGNSARTEAARSGKVVEFPQRGAARG